MGSTKSGRPGGIDPGSKNELHSIRALFRAYTDWLWVAGRAAGCVALHEMEPEIREINRLYVVPECRDRGIGEALTLTVIKHAATQKLCTLRLDTIPRMNTARRLYERLGFRPIKPCNDTPIPAGRVKSPTRWDSARHQL